MPNIMLSARARSVISFARKPMVGGIPINDITASNAARVSLGAILDTNPSLLMSLVWRWNSMKPESMKRPAL